ncbi:MAG: hypothetical protein AAGU11_09260, partial [Syntrophobacteraceae bacterium]
VYLKASTDILLQRITMRDRSYERSMEAGYIASLNEAYEKRQEAEWEAESYRAKNERFEAEREKMMAEAHEEVKTRRGELVHAARDEVEGMRQKWLAAIREEKQSFLLQLRNMICRKVYTTSRRALKELADADIQQRLVSLFYEKIRGMDLNRLMKGSQHTLEAGKIVKVRSAFEISSEMRNKFKDFAIKLAPGAEVEFEIEPDLICGIELDAFHHKIGWSIADYLEGLEESVSEMIHSKAKAPGFVTPDGNEEHRGDN